LRRSTYVWHKAHELLPKFGHRTGPHLVFLTKATSSTGDELLNVQSSNKKEHLTCVDLHDIFDTNRIDFCPNLRLDGLLVVDESIGRTVVRCDFGGAFEFGINLLGQLLAKFHTPLVERVNVPNGALRKDFHFVHGNETTKLVCLGT
jgi:hypothetical protein